MRVATNFILGEDKYLKFLVKSLKGEDFEISKATISA